MANLRAQSIKILDPQNIEVSFSDSLREDIGISNISISSETPGVPIPSILEVSVSGKILAIRLQPLTALAAYYVIFNKTASIPFRSLNGDNILLEDGIANQLFFLGAVEDDNSVKQYLLSYLAKNVYGLEAPSNINKYISNISIPLSKALADIKQVGNENYISKTIIDEIKIRGTGGFDRLDQEGAYEVLRVGKTTTNASVPMSLSFNDFPTFPVSLLKTNISTILSVNSVDGDNVFNINSFIITLSHRFVSVIDSIVFKYDDGRLDYSYDINHFGYQIADNIYDKDRAFTYFGLNDNQIKLSDKVLADDLFSLENIFMVDVTYQYKDAGRVIDVDSVIVSSTLSSGREALPPIRNIFDLKHAPITSSNGLSGSTGLVQFIDPNALIGSKHPAFRRELPFRLEALPSRVGDYAVDYALGRVYVVGDISGNAGTGLFPPIAIYNYKLSYKQDIDYSLEEDSFNLVALPNGSVIGSDITISFNYEKNLAREIDYIPLLHAENLNERIENRLSSLNSITTKNSNITDVFRIYNETSGEIYKVSRWFNNKVYFTYNTPPQIKETIFERATFDLISNETLFVSDVINQTSFLKIYQLQLNNDRIMSATEDAIGASFNSSISFSHQDLFQKEIYFNARDSIDNNLSRLSSLGEYQVDYNNGVIYLLLSIDQDNEIGSVSYRRAYIIPNFPHVTSVEDIYYQISLLGNKEREISYLSFEDREIIPKDLDLSDEQGISNDYTIDYVLLNGQVGSFQDGVFSEGVKDSIKFIRSIYDINDLIYNQSPLNFSESSSFSEKIISLNPITRQEYRSIRQDGYNKVIDLNFSLLYLSPNITPSISVKRISDNQELWIGGGSLSLGSQLILILPSGTIGNVNDSVVVNYSFTINDLSHLVIDYNRGELYIDYSYLADEILISYEYGDNSLDFRKSNYLDVGETYYVSYKVGALRNALLNNFGSLIDISVLNSFDIIFNRERYRDGIFAAMSSLGSGPTVAAIKNIAQTISHLPAELTEAAFESWSLGSSQLYQDLFKTTGELQLSRNKHTDGISMIQDGQTISLPAVGNLKVEEGTFESWVKPEWDGIDNNAELTFYVSHDGYDMAPTRIFIGASEYHPKLSYDYVRSRTFFRLTKNDLVAGLPNKKKTGLFVYLSEDPSGGYERWMIDVLDGYDTGSNHTYRVEISTSSKFYDTKSSILPKPSSSSISSTESSITFTTVAHTFNQGISFVSDNAYYLMDAGKIDRSRISIYRDEFGYLNFRVIDDNKNVYSISADISIWKNQELHHVSASWKIDTIFGRDELHLFIDGFEVPNIIRYGNRAGKYFHEKYRTINLEEIVGKISKGIIGSTDLSGLVGTSSVTSSINFSDYAIVAGDIIFIEEDGFDLNGYSIINVNGNTLTLSSTLPIALVQGKYSVNKQAIPVKTELDRFSNISVSTMHSVIHGTDLSAIAGTGNFSSTAQNFTNLGIIPGYLLSYSDNVYNILQVSGHNLTTDGYNGSSFSGVPFNIYTNNTIEIPGIQALNPSYSFERDGYGSQQLILSSSALANDLIIIKNFGLNHRKVRSQYYVYGNQSNILKTRLPAPTSLDDVRIRKIIKQKIIINSTSTIVPDSQPNTVANGRTLEVIIAGSNSNLSSTMTVTINGQGYNLSNGAPISLTEVISISQYGSFFSSNQYSHVDNFQINNPLPSSISFEVKEKYSLTQLENNGLFNSSPPVIRFAYQLYQGADLQGDGYGNLSSPGSAFSDLFIGNSLIIHSPAGAAGSYPILGIDENRSNFQIGSDFFGNLPPAFSGGIYEVLNITNQRTGLANGYFTFEYKDLVGNPLFLSQGAYEVEYYAYLNIPFDLSGGKIFIGTDLLGKNKLDGNISEIRLLGNMLTDVRIGETEPSNQRSITKDFNSVKLTKKDENTLLQVDLDSLPIKNTADIYHNEDNKIIKSGNVINENFGRSILLDTNPIILDNDGLISPKEGTIEFWINPIFDSNNDPNERYYLDVSSNVKEEVVSQNKTTISIAGKASSINHIRLAIDELSFDYAAAATLSSDKQTILLKKALPNQNTPVTVFYIPNGLSGDRISLFKDNLGYLNFRIRANSTEYLVRSPTFWERNSWHRIRASYKTGTSNDSLRILVDGYSYNELLIDGSVVFGNYVNFGSSPMSLRSVIKLKDSLNTLFIGCDQEKTKKAYCLIDNLRISNIKRADYAPYGEVIDPNWSSNLESVYPIMEDAVTTLLLNYNALQEKITDFALLNNKNNSLSDFTLEVFDGLDIIKNNPRSKEILEKLVSAFRPANARPFINYSDS